MYIYIPAIYIYIELYKYGGDELVNMLQILFNKMFTSHEAINDIGAGYLFPLNKPDKPKRVENTRPVTLLNVIRKILSYNIYLLLSTSILE